MSSEALKLNLVLNSFFAFKYFYLCRKTGNITLFFQCHHMSSQTSWSLPNEEHTVSPKLELNYELQTCQFK